VAAFRRAWQGGCPDAASSTHVISDDELSAKFPQLKPKYMEETARFALVAAAEALEHAGLSSGARCASAPPNDRIGLALGTLAGPTKWCFENGHLDASWERDNPKVSAVSSAVAYYGSLLGNVTIPLRVAGPSLILCNLDVAGTDAVGYAYDAVRHGKSPIMLAGGADSPVTPMIEAGLKDAGARFERERGLRLLSGSAMLVLEEWNHASDRGATILGEVLGYGTRASLSDCGPSLLEDLTRGQDVDCVVGTGIAPHEPEALRRIFEDRTEMPPVANPTLVAGFPAAASGAVQAVASVILLGHQAIGATRATPIQTADTAAGVGVDEPDRCTKRPRLVLQASTGLSKRTSVLLFGVPEGLPA
jgi:3-oxoacyl-(acyl-carrier-protein) synthase